MGCVGAYAPTHPIFRISFVFWGLRRPTPEQLQEPHFWFISTLKFPLPWMVTRESGKGK